MSAYEKVWKLFFKVQIGEFQRAETAKASFVHYTSAENIIKIIDGRNVWLRNVRSMNDYSEVRHGIQVITEFFGNKKQKEFWDLIESRQVGLAQEVKNSFDELVDKIYMDTYIACVSEYDEENFPLGKLSMWRAYAANNGVAAVLQPRAMLGASPEIGANTYPVIYANQNQAFDHFTDFVSSVIDNQKLFLELEPVEIKHILSVYFSTMSFSLKNQAFVEEQEWRIVYRPWEKSSDFLKIGFESIRGLPQPVYKFPLQDSEAVGIKDINPNKLIEKIIIGPSENSYLIYRALKGCLERNDFKMSKIELSFLTSH